VLKGRGARGVLSPEGGGPLWRGPQWPPSSLSLPFVVAEQTPCEGLAVAVPPNPAAALDPVHRYGAYTSRMTIGELAKACGVGVETIRFYERSGLVADPRRKGVGYRDYPEDAARRVRFIKQAQGLGFTLKEIADLLALRVSPRTTCADVRAKASAKIADIQEKVRTLRSYEAALQQLVAQCSGSDASSDCPILDAIEDQGSNHHRPAGRSKKEKRS